MKSSNSTNTGPHKVTMEKWISCAPFEELLNMEIIEAVDGRATLTMPFLFEYAQGAGIMNGGALVSLADTAVVMAIKSILTPPVLFGTVSLEAKFLRPVRQGIITAKAVVSRPKESTLIGDAMVYDDAGEAVVEFSSVFKVSKRQPSPSSDVR